MLDARSRPRAACFPALGLRGCRRLCESWRSPARPRPLFDALHRCVLVRLERAPARAEGGPPCVSRPAARTLTPRCVCLLAASHARLSADATRAQHARLKSIPDLDRVAILVRACGKACTVRTDSCAAQAEALPYLQKFHGACARQSNRVTQRLLMPRLQARRSSSSMAALQ